MSRAELARQLRTLGVEQSGVLLVHTSFRAVRPIEGGPAGLIAALRAVLGPDGTLVMPSWTPCAECDAARRSTLRAAGAPTGADVKLSERI